MNRTPAVTHFATCIAQTLGLPSEEVEVVRRAAVVHDIGKIGVPDSVLRKPGPMSASERRLMEEHVMIGVRILEQLHTMNHELPIVRAHHERWDGGGYPSGLAGSDIPQGARILVLADAFDAITSNRVYRRARSVSDAVEILIRERAKHFAPAEADALLSWVHSFGDPEKLTVTDLLASDALVTAT